MPGHLTEADLWNAYPIDNRLKVGKVTGRQLREFWENELEHVYASDPDKLFGGWLPRPSGLALRFKARAPRGERIVSLEVQGKPVQDDAIYTVAACEREGDHEDTLCRIPHVSEPKVLDLDAHQAVRRYLARHSPVTEPTMGRVVAVDLPANMHSQFFDVLGQARPVKKPITSPRWWSTSPTEEPGRNQASEQAPGQSGRAASAKSATRRACFRYRLIAPIRCCRLTTRI